MKNYGIVPPTGALGEDWFKNFVLQQGHQGSLSCAGWSLGNEGFPQQTFLGASIRDFTINAGFGDTSSTMSVELVDDEFHKSDGRQLGYGEDVYHNGERDLFRPPAVGSPVWFKFGKNPATVEQAWRKTFDETYGYNTIKEKDFAERNEPNDKNFTLPKYHFVDLENSNDKTYKVVDKSPLWDIETDWRGKDHIVFGGILQGFTSNESPQGKSLYTANVTDPREILSNCVVLLNNYQGTTFNNKNLFNVYGFLEYDPSDELKEYLNFTGTASVLNKTVLPNGNVFYSGDDTYEFPGGLGGTSSIPSPGTNGKLPTYFPITGQGFSRRSTQGIPFYRVSQALTAMFEYNGVMPAEYINAGFGGRINFRGFNYVVDFSGIALDRIPNMYFMDFDQMDLLSFAQEICDVISHELFVQLLPIIDHPACDFLEKENKRAAKQGRFSDIISGIIRLDAIDKSQQPRYGAILEYLKEVSDNGVDVLNQDVGFELTNETTDKFVVGAQEVEMYFFHTNNDRDDEIVRRSDDQGTEIMRAQQWLLETSLKQQVLPYYGLLGENAVSIPRGFGSWQQILLDTRNLNAFGVGNYYVATEMELRAALVSYNRWKNFLLAYNESYVSDVSEFGATWSLLGDIGDGEINEALQPLIAAGVNEDTPFGSGFLAQFKNRKFAVTAPRCVWDSDRPYMDEYGYPASPCSPPFGYPLYYKRATRIGIPEGGIVSVINANTRAISNKKLIEDKVDGIASGGEIKYDEYDKRLARLMEQKNLRERNAEATGASGILENDQSYQDLLEQINKVSEIAKGFRELKREMFKQGSELVAETSVAFDDLDSDLTTLLPDIAKAHTENAKKVYQFVKKVAEENLGKKFLVKIPKACNVRYQPRISVVAASKATVPTTIAAGPFGFAPDTTNGIFSSRISQISKSVTEDDYFLHYTNVDITDFNNNPLTTAYDTNHAGGAYRNGALKCNYNPIEDKWNYNYKPEPQGGWFNYSLFQNTIDVESKAYKKQEAIQETLAPFDITNFVSENGRLQCYVKYNNSQHLNFQNVGANQMTQQVFDGNNSSWMPDLISSIPNTRPDQLGSYNFGNGDYERLSNQTPAVAFVKCDVDEKLYMPPRMVQKSVDVYARKYEVYLSNIDSTIVEDVDEDGCPIYREKTNRLDPVISVPKDGGRDGYDTTHVDFVRYTTTNYIDNVGVAPEYIINTQNKYLDSNHVYALITVPGRIQPTIDSRWNRTKNFDPSVEKALTMSVVKIPEFSKPAFPELEQVDINCEELDDDKKFFTYQNLTEVQGKQRQIRENIKYNQSQELETVQPSPVYPDMVAIPLLSWERCYGPWLSSAKLNDTRERYTNLGGKIEFDKDENLAPWNYGGYQLLNEAGLLKAEFSNSLLLISERGGFVIPEIPTGISLAKALKQSGPLVTSISANVTQNSIKTTVKLDVYTASYGKLQKQKEKAIATIQRERQKITDQNNNAIRRGMGKSQSSINPVQNVLANGGQKILDIVKGQEDFISREEKESKMNLMVVRDDKTHVAEEGHIRLGQEGYKSMAQKTAAFGAVPLIGNLSNAVDIVSKTPNGGAPAGNLDVQQTRNDNFNL